MTTGASREGFGGRGTGGWLPVGVGGGCAPRRDPGGGGGTVLRRGAGGRPPDAVFAASPSCVIGTPTAHLRTLHNAPFISVILVQRC